MNIAENKLRKLIKEEIEIMFRPRRSIDDSVVEKGETVLIEGEEFYVLQSRVFETEEGQVSSLALKRPDGRYTYRVIMKEDGSFTPVVPTHTVQGWLV